MVKHCRNTAGICSNLLFSFSVWGDQTLAQFSRFDLTMDLYAKVLVSVFWIDRFRLKRRAARYVTNRYHNTSSVSAMLKHLQLPTLEHRRNLNRITMLYEITNNLIAVDPKLYLTPQPSLSTRNNNPLQSTRTNKSWQLKMFKHCRNTAGIVIAVCHVYCCSALNLLYDLIYV
jgi:hypothetical protein